MTKITVKKLTTSNNTPTLTGTVEFQRFSMPGKAKESIEVYVNYVPYRLFDGNLGLDETKTPNEWKLRFDSPLYPGTYDVEAIVYDIATNQILASDDTKDELIITAPTRISAAQQQYNLRQRYARLSLLMNSIDLLFGGKNGLTPLPSVHPTLDDQSTTALPANGNEERAEDSRTKSKDKTRMTGVPLPPKKTEFASVDPGNGAGAGSGDWELASLDAARDTVGLTATEQNQADAQAAAALGASAEEVANISGRAGTDEAAEFARSGGFFG
jgi:hypothetical protein